MSALQPSFLPLPDTRAAEGRAPFREPSVVAAWLSRAPLLQGITPEVEQTTSNFIFLTTRTNTKKPKARVADTKYVGSQ